MRKEHMGNAPGAAAVPVVPLQTQIPAAAQSEKPAEILYESKEIVFMSDVPIVLENTAIIMDRTKDKVFARCGFRSMTEAAIKAVLVEITCEDVWGSALGEPIAFQYLDLKTARDSKFGQTDLIDLPEKTTRKIQVAVKKVLFADGSVVSGGGADFTMPAPVLLEEHLGSDDLAAEYARETTAKARFLPKDAGRYWLCTCGALNEGAEEKCHDCGCTREQLTAALDLDTLQANMTVFAEEKKAAEEKAAEQARLEQEQKDRERELAEKQTRSKKRRKKTVTTIIILLIVSAVLACGTIFFGIPYYKYRAACDALENGRYDEAYVAFASLNGFMDSVDLANRAVYEKAVTAMEEKRYDDAIRLFEAMDGHRDSEDLLLECKYLRADQYQADKKYMEAYELFVKLGDYKESKNEVLATILLWESRALGSYTTTDANAFSRTVKLDPSQYESFYTTILLYLNAHEDSTYWVEGAGESLSQNVQTMLKMLPSTYKDTATLLKLFNLLASEWTEFDELFRDNETLMRQCWSLPFIQDMAEHDGAITYFLEGYWTGSGYYLNFYPDENGLTYSNFDLPWVAEPYGTKYYVIDDMIYYWADENINHLAKVFRFEIVDYDTIKVFCYKNNRTYTMYR